ncbi:MAG: pyruvate ferredoxin oxidoreductase [Dehalococcoidia bacterium]|nr:pyruvate ferredoxin oxidoreductase [Dehalococcoidia bacterium]
MKRVGLESSLAIAEAVRLAGVDVVSAYPITPQTHIIERIAQMVADGDLNASYIPVESEHSAMSGCLGAAAMGVRTFTATAGQGLELMHEVLPVASAMRLPVVMAICNRALSSPLSIWGDHSDIMAARDSGWVQMFAENGQQAFDLTLCAFRIAEDVEVLLPTAINIDGFHLSHVIESVLIPEQGEVDKFLPELPRPYVLDPRKPLTMGDFATPELYIEAKKSQDVALRNSKKVILQAWQEFEGVFGRRYSPVETYRADGASVLLLTMGSFSEVAMEAIDRLRESGEKVGLIRLRLWRPFPFEEFRQVASQADLLVVLDRAVSFGGPGPVCSEVQAALYPLSKKPQVAGFIGGLGGRDITTEGFEDMIRNARKKADAGRLGEVEIIGVRE